MRKILVTGAAGFIGSNFVQYMLQRYKSYQIIALDALTYAGNLQNFGADAWNSPQFIFVRGSVGDRQLVEDLVAQCDSIVHFAAETHVDNSINDYNTDDFIDTDVKGSQILFDAIRHIGVERFLHISTSEVYGTAEYVPMHESHPLNPRSPYASAKAAADRIAYSYHITFGLPIAIIRPFNNYGPKQHIEKLVPQVITQALRDMPIAIHGDGRSTRDWLYVSDHCAALDAALHAPIQTIAGQAINLGTGTDTSVRDVTVDILDQLGKPRTLVQYTVDRPGQVQRHIADTERARQLLGWSATTSLTAGLEQTINWFRSNPSHWQSHARKQMVAPNPTRWGRRTFGVGASERQVQHNGAAGAVAEQAPA